MTEKRVLLDKTTYEFRAGKAKNSKSTAKSPAPKSATTKKES